MVHNAGVELAFETKKLRSWCEDGDGTEAHLKPEVAERLQDRLADCKAADSPVDLIAGVPQLIEGRYPRLKISLGEDYLIIFKINHIKIPLTTEGRIDWSRVRRIKVMSIGRSN